MGKYRSVGQILVDKEYLHQNDFNAVVRAVRRNMITGTPVANYLHEKKMK